MQLSVSPALGILLSIVAIVGLALVSCGGAATPAPAPSRVNEQGSYTKAVVEQAVQRYADEGKEATVAYYNTMESVDGDWYVFIFEEDGTLIAHPTVPESIGENITGPSGTDVTGKYFGGEIVGATEEGQWVEYVYLNPANDNRYERKHSWVVKRDGLIFGSGWYERNVEVDADPAAITQDYVRRAMHRYNTQGRDATIAHYNDMKSVEGDWYLFVADEAGKIIVHATVPDNIGEDLAGPLGIDITGKDFGTEMVAATEEGRWVDYVYPNPADENKYGRKHSWVVKHDGLIFGSGWYEQDVEVEEDDEVFTKAFVQRALRRYDTQGRDATVAYYGNMDSVYKDWYLFAMDGTGRVVIHTTVPDNIGRNLNGPLGTDVTGKDFGSEMMSATEEGHWVDYVYLNPANENRYERKHSWVVRHDGLVFGSGWYDREVDVEEDPAVFTRAFVERALSLYDTQGRDAAFTYYNSLWSVDGEWYLFVADETGNLLVHATVPENVGQSLIGPLGTDVTGKDFGSEMLSATEDGRWVDYVFQNPANENKNERKHSWVVRHDGLIFGSGWYERDVVIDS